MVKIFTRFVFKKLNTMRLIILFTLLITFNVGKSTAQNWDFAKKIEFQGNNVMLDNFIYQTTDASGNVYIAASVTSMMSWYRIHFDANNFLDKKSDHDIFIAKFNANGSFAWAKSFGDSNSVSISSIADIAVDPQGNPIIIGSHNADLTFNNLTLYSYNGVENTFIVKLNASNGSSIWASQFSASAVNPGSRVKPTAIDIDNNGNIYVSGFYSGLCNFGSSVNPAMSQANEGETDLYLTRLSSSGSLQWFERFYSSGSKMINDIKCDQLGNIILVGSYKDAGPIFGLNQLLTSNNEEAFIIKLNSNKGLEWMKSTTGSSSSKRITSLDVDNSGNIYALGAFLNDGLLNLDNLNLNGFGGTVANSDILLLKYSSTGSLEWLKKAGGLTNDNAINIDVANEGYFFISTNLRNGQSYSPLSISSNLGQAVVKYGVDGNAASYKNRDNGIVTYGTFEIQQSGNGFLTGYFNNSAQFGNTTLTISNGFSTEAIYIAKYFETLVIPSEVKYFYPSKAYVNKDVVIYGKNFNSATSVSFNNILSSNFRIVNDTIIVAKVPSNATTGKIKVEFTGGITALSQNDIFIVSNSNSGTNWNWAKQNSSASSDEYIVSTATDFAGNIISVGNYKNNIIFESTTLNSLGLTDMFITKWSSNGTLLWAKSFGGGLEDQINSVCTDFAGNIYITGYYNSQIAFDTSQLFGAIGNSDIFVVKLNPNGNVVWAKTAVGYDGNDIGIGINCDLMGNVSITGSIVGTVVFDNITLSLSSLGSSKMFVAKYNSRGNIMWAMEARGGGNASASSITTDAHDNTYVMGIIPGTLNIGGVTLSTTPAWWIDNFIAKFDKQGGLVWAKVVKGTPSYSGRITSDLEGNIYFSGTENINNNEEVVIAKYNTNGDEQWKLIGQGPLLDYALDVDVSISGDIAVCGQFNTTLSLGSQNLSGHSLFGDEMFVAKINNAGNVLSLQQVENTNVKSEKVSNVSFNIDNEIIVAGAFSGSPIFGPTTLNAITGTDLFIAKLSNSSTSTHIVKNEALIVYPNPSQESDLLYFNACDKLRSSTYKIYDNLGREVMNGDINTNNCSINIRNLSNGIYIIQTEHGNSTFIKNKL